MAAKVKVKMKTDRGVAKRFKKKKTGSGHFKCRHQNLRHILTKKSRKRKRSLRVMNIVHTSNIRAIMRQLPYA